MKRYSPTIDQLREFYRVEPPNLSNISDLAHRHFRLVMPRGNFLKLQDRIRSPHQLQNWLVKLGAFDAFYTSSRYLDPTNIMPRPKEPDAFFAPSQIILGNDVIFDVDFKPLSRSNLEKARESALDIYECLKGRGYRNKYIAFSGSKGFHLVFEDPEPGHFEHPFEREMNIIQRRKTLVREMLNEGFNFDKAVTVDTRRIIRVPGTINSKTGLCCTIISPDLLACPVREVLAQCPGLPGHMKPPTFAIPSFGRRKKRLAKHHMKGKRHVARDVAYTTFLLSPVLGIKGRHAVLMSFPRTSIGAFDERLKGAMERFDLTDIYVFALLDRLLAISLKTVQRNRYHKILEYMGSPDADQLERYSHVSIRMGPLVNERFEEIEPEARLLFVLRCSDDVRESEYVSAGHLTFLEKHGIEALHYPLTHGNGRFKIRDVELGI